MNRSTIALNPWEPLAGFRNLQRDVNRLLDLAPAVSRTRTFPLVNVFANAEEAVVVSEIPGIDPAALDLKLIKGRLTISGTFENDVPEGEGVTCHRKERPSGSFSRTIDLPFEVDEERIIAKHDKGVLTISLPRAERSKPRTIPVNAG